MTKCLLTIDLTEHESTTFAAGDTVTGTVHLQAFEAMRCNAITVLNKWETHGKGNVATGKSPEVILHQGDIVAGQKLSFPFSLQLLPWPPTYHGNYFNLDHMIEARVDIPWGFDVTAQRRLTIVGGSEELSEDLSGAAIQSSAQGCLLAGFIVFIIVFVMIFLVSFPGPLLLVLVLGLVGGGILLIKSVLPRWKLGAVEVSLPKPMVAAGGTLVGELKLAPKQSLQINGIDILIKCSEECVSGSGSNRRTHRHEVWSTREQLHRGGMLNAGQQVVPFEAQIPANAIPSIKVKDNEIKWQFELRVDIPRWPDFVMRAPLKVVRRLAGVQLGVPQADWNKKGLPMADEALFATESTNTMSGARASEDAVSLDETASFLLAAEGDHEQIETLVAAVRGLDFPLTAIVDRTSLYTGTTDREYAYPNGRIAFARLASSDLDLTLYLPPGEAAKVEGTGESTWTGRGVVVGYDFQHQRLQVQVVDENGSSNP